MSEFRDAVAAAAQGTPYTVVHTKDGFDVELDIANAHWWDLFHRAGLRKSFRWRVVERNSHFTVTDRQFEVRWRAGVPTLGGSMGVRGGRIFSFSLTKIWALSYRGRIEPWLHYRFNSREGGDLIRLVARQLGRNERLPLSLKLTLALIAVTPAGVAIWGLVLLVARISGVHL